MTNFRNDAESALRIAAGTLKHLSDGFQRSDSEQLTYALAQATIGIGYSLLQIIELKDQGIDTRQG
jgi:hypothetical protein